MKYKQDKLWGGAGIIEEAVIWAQGGGESEREKAGLLGKGSTFLCKIVNMCPSPNHLTTKLLPDFYSLTLYEKAKTNP